MKKLHPEFGVRRMRQSLRKPDMQELCSSIIDRTPALHSTQTARADFRRRIESVLCGITPEDILRREEGEERSTSYALRHGSKELLVFHEEPANALGTFLKADNRHKPLERETTVLYASSRVLMQMIAEEYQKILHYKFVTANKRLQRWASTHGAHIFHWDNTWDAKSFGICHQAIIRPGRSA